MDYPALGPPLYAQRMNSIWLVLVSLAAFSLAYRFYSAFIAARVLSLDDSRITPAHRLEDGVDYHPTNKFVLFGHHFAAIAGSGPLIGPVLAAQWGYFPGFAWIVIGSCLAGAVHDVVILLASVRNDGHTISRLAGTLLGPVAGFLASIATLCIVIATLASTALIVVNALSQSAWATFTIVLTIPAALATGLWMYRIRPGRIGEASIVGLVILLLGVFLGKPFADSSFAHYLMFSKPTLSIILPVYAAVASILPVWLLMCPRDYLSSYIKIGVVLLLAGGLILVQPELRMPATTPFIHGGGPVVSGAVWPFVCIVIMCGALSGFHALIATGTTPRMINQESDIRPIGYGGMIIEGFVALCALIAACSLEPGDYFRINVADGANASYASFDDFQNSARSQYGWDLAPRELRMLEEKVDEKLEGRIGGAVTLAVGMAKVFSNIPGMHTLTAYWYHFILMFEALFILTLLETGTRVARFMFQESFQYFRKEEEATHKVSWTWNITSSVGVCFLWGFLLYTGNLNALWRMFGVANQNLAAIGLTIGTIYILKNSQKRAFALVTGLPLVFVIATVYYGTIGSIGGWFMEIQKGLAPLQAFFTWLLCILSLAMLIVTFVVLVQAARVAMRMTGAQDQTISFR